MSEKKIVDLARYRQQKTQTDGKAESGSSQNLSFEEKLQAFIHRPITETGSKEELIEIFEQEQKKQDRKDQE